MFSKANKFFKKNILLIGIVVLLIIIAIYFLYINVKEGFLGPVPEKVQLIPVSTIEKIYNNLPNQTYKDIGAPVVELYKFFVANYNEAFDVSLQIIAATKEIEAANKEIDAVVAAANAPNPITAINQQMTEGFNSTPFQMDKIQAVAGQDAQLIQLAPNQQTSTSTSTSIPNVAPRNDAVLKTWAPKINPGIQNVLINAIRWLPTAKQYYDKFASNNYYGLLDGTLLPPDQAGRDKMLTLYVLAANTLYEDDQLKTLFGPDFAKGSPTLPIPLPTNNEQMRWYQEKDNNTQQMMDAGDRAREYSTKYGQNLTFPFMIIQQYLMENAMADPANSVIPNTIIQLIEKLNAALANDAADQASIGQLTGKLNAALANDAADQASITRLEGRVNELQTPLVAPVVPKPVVPAQVIPKYVPKYVSKPPKKSFFGLSLF